MKSPGQDDAKQFQVVKQAMSRVGFNDADVDEVFHIIAGILHVGNIKFKQDGNYAKISTPDIVKTAAQVRINSHTRPL